MKDLLRRGERQIVLDLARVRSIDAAGVGQLVRVYNLTRAADGVLRIVHATRWVREILERVALLGLLTGRRDRDLDRKRFKRLRTRRELKSDRRYARRRCPPRFTVSPP